MSNGLNIFPRDGHETRFWNINGDCLIILVAKRPLNRIALFQLNPHEGGILRLCDASNRQKKEMIPCFLTTMVFAWGPRWNFF